MATALCGAFEDTVLMSSKARSKSTMMLILAILFLSPSSA